MVNNHTLKLFQFGDAGESTVTTPQWRLEWEVGHWRHDSRLQVSQCERVAEAIFNKNAVIGLFTVGVKR